MQPSGDSGWVSHWKTISPCLLQTERQLALSAHAAPQAVMQKHGMIRQHLGSSWKAHISYPCSVCTSRCWFSWGVPTKLKDVLLLKCLLFSGFNNWNKISNDLGAPLSVLWLLQFHENIFSWRFQKHVSSTPISTTVIQGSQVGILFNKQKETNLGPEGMR